MFAESIRDLVIMLFNLICAVIVLSLGIAIFSSSRSLGANLSNQKVEERHIHEEYKFNGVDEHIYTRDEIIALILDNIAEADFEMCVKLTETENRAQVEADKRLFNRENYINNTSDYTVEALKARLETGSTYQAFLVYKGNDVTSVTQSHGATDRSDYITGITFIKQP